MSESDIELRISELERKIASYPQGSLATKKIKGKNYYYQRYTHNGKRKEIYVDFDKVEGFQILIEKRKKLEKELKELKNSLPATKTTKPKRSSHKYSTYVRIDDQLKNLALPVQNYKKRECYAMLHNFVFGEQQDKVFILYGLRRTGKTTLIRQILLDMSTEELQKAAFIQIKTGDTLSDINSDLKYLEKQGFKYIFIDEATLMENFIEDAALFSDIYASSGIKIVLSGTDSLGFIFTRQEQLFDRCILLHTTFISYREFENILGIKGIDEYIRYGGTMSMGGINYNETSSFANEKNASEYIDSAVVRNIQHSLKYYPDGGHFRHLLELSEKGELAYAINRVLEDINHRFIAEVLTRAFITDDLRFTARTILHERTNPMDNSNIDRDTLTNTAKELLEILNREEQPVGIDPSHVLQIKEYLTLLDLITDIDVVQLPYTNQHDEITVVSQPGLRYAQTDALINSLLMDASFNALSVIDRHQIAQRILSEMKERMMKDIVLLETKLANPRKEVFRLQFSIGAFDMVIFDPDTLSCEIYEIKYNSRPISSQYLHLINLEKCGMTEHRFGTITGRFVIYLGNAAESEGIKYINVEDFLKNIR